MLQAQAAAYGDVMVRSPAEALLAAGVSLDYSVQALEGMAREVGASNPALIREIREAAKASGAMAKLIQDAGIDERRARLGDAQGQLVATVIRGVLDDLRLSPAQAAMVSEVVPRHLRRLAGVN